MKQLSFFVICLLALSVCKTSAQKQYYTINPGEKITEALPKGALYAYPEFSSGKVYLRKGGYLPGLLNYNFLIAEMQFIDSKGDTLSLADEENIKFIAVNSDTFYFDNGYLRLTKAYGELKLAQKQFLYISNQEKIGGYGTKTTSSHIESYSYVSTLRGIQNLVVQEITTLGRANIFYVGDKFNHFKKVEKKALLHAYPKKEKEIKEFFKDKADNTISEEDVAKLMELLKGIQ
jgi:hypothetical protein